MVELKTQYPYIDDNGKERKDLIRHYAEDTEGNEYYIKQNETGIVYAEAIDVYPCRYTYTELDEKIETLGE